MTLSFNYQEELRDISELLEVIPSPGWEKRLDTFRPWLSGYLEYQVKLDKPALAVVTLGKDEEFMRLVGTQLVEMGASRSFMEAFHDLQQRAGKATWGLKLSIGNASDLQLYIKKPIPVTAANDWLRAHGLPEATAKLLGQVADDLKKSHTHFVGLDATADEVVPFQIYFTQYSDDVHRVLSNLLAVAQRVGLPDSSRQAIERSVSDLLLMQRTIWVSFPIVGNELLPAMKLDFSSPPKEKALQLFSDSQQQKIRLLAQTVGIGKVDYAGFHFAGDNLPRPSLYVTRVR